MTSVSNYQCPNCGGPLHFDSELQKLKCDFCGSEFNPSEIEALYAEQNEKAVAAEEKKQEQMSGWSPEEQEHLRTFTCPSCGAELTGDETMAATNCPYCGNPNLIPSQFTNSAKPDFVLPFEMDKKHAEEALKKFYANKPFLPDTFKDQNQIEKIKGVYVPFWLFDGELHVDGMYDATTSTSFTRGDDRITETKHFKLHRAGDISFHYVPADASSKMKDEFMDAVEPFNFDKLTAFQMAYLAGYYADRYDVSEKENKQRVKDRMANTAKSELRKTTVGYQTSVPISENYSTKDITAKYAYLPVWMIATRWNDTPYQFAMNGQTGKMIGDPLPIDKGKVFKAFILYFVIIAIVITAIIFFMVD